MTTSNEIFTTILTENLLVLYLFVIRVLLLSKEEVWTDQGAVCPAEVHH